MSRYELLSFTGPQELATAAASRWVEQLASRRANSYCVALSGGRIAGRVFDTLAGLAMGRLRLFDRVHFHWSDERCVPPTDPESNFALAAGRLLRPLQIPDPQVHRIRGEDPPQSAAAQAERELRKVASEDTEGRPVLDMVFLGVGEDGHVASLFPGGSGGTRPEEPVYYAVVGPKPPPQRITLSYRCLVAARQVWVLASGRGKERALRESLGSPARTPLGRVLELRTQTVIFSDIGLR